MYITCRQNIALFTFSNIFSYLSLSLNIYFISLYYLIINLNYY